VTPLFLFFDRSGRSFLFEHSPFAEVHLCIFATRCYEADACFPEDTNMQDTVLPLLDDLCRTRGFRKDKDGPGEEAIAHRVADELRRYPWLTVTVEDIGEGIFNVMAFDGPPAEVKFLLVGHLDTVTPSLGWTREEFFNDGAHYYALGAVDTRGGIAGALDAIGKVGPTRGVGYLFYGDEEYQFVGMKEFVQSHPNVAPKFGLSVCGGKGEACLGWRGCTEMEFLYTGVSGHASRAWDGANAAEAVAYVMEAVRRACVEHPGAMKTAANIAAVHVGSLGVSEKPYVLGVQKQTPPPMVNIANRTPDVGWVLLDVRPGDTGVTAAFIEAVARKALAAWNAAKEHSVRLTVYANFEMPAYAADRERIGWLFDVFRPVHAGRVSPLASTGFLDVTLIAGLHGTQFLCLSQAGGNAHGADEYVEIASLMAYRDASMVLLSAYRR
jgi:acetylornithine deacetylase/succinyl-diaminopimelate desuccinylase-like protein